MAKYERKAGMFSEGDTYAKIIVLMDELQDQIDILGHNLKMQGPAHELKGQGMLAVAEMIKVIRVQFTNLATGKIRRSAGYR